MTFTDNPIKDFMKHDKEAEEKLARLPVCELCGEPIQQEFAIYYADQWCCEECEHDFWKSIRSDFLEKVEEE